MKVWRSAVAPAPRMLPNKRTASFHSGAICEDTRQGVSQHLEKSTNAYYHYDQLEAEPPPYLAEPCPQVDG